MRAVRQIRRGEDDASALQHGAVEIDGRQQRAIVQILRRLGTGGMAEVWKARAFGASGFEKIVVLKVLLPELRGESLYERMFVDEARVCARLGHPNIVQVFDFGEEDGELYMAMEYVDGTTGARLVRAVAVRGEDIPLDVCLHVTLSILHALDYLVSRLEEHDRLLLIDDVFDSGRSLEAVMKLHHLD